MFEQKILRPDNKGRICLGKLAKGVSSYRVSVDKQQRILLEPYAEIPAREKWLFDNPEALNALKQGLSDSKAGRVKDRGSFAKYIDDSDNE